MSQKAQDKKRHWSREGWFFVVLLVIYAALVAYGLAGGIQLEPSDREAGMPPVAERVELALPTTDPSLVTPAPAQTPPGTRRKLDVNQADAWMLTAIPGIGQALADRIVAYRDSQGVLVSIEELHRVEGVGDRLFSTLAEYLEVR